MRPLIMFLAAVIAAPAASGTTLDDVGLGHVEDQWSTSAGGASLSGPWWSTLDDPQMHAVIDEALRHSPDLASARERVVQAKAIAGQQGSALVPTVTFDLQGSMTPYDSLGFQFGGNLPFGNGEDDPNAIYSGSAKFNAGWGLDLFGRQVSAFQASRKDASASASDEDDAVLQIAALVAAAYLDVVSAEAQLQVIEQQLRDSEALLGVLEARFGASDAGALDVLQQRQQVATLRARLPSTRTLVATQRQQLMVLTGGYVPATVEVAGALPEPGELPALGRPSDLLDTRPDLQAAVARHDAARNRAWSSTAAALPSVQLGASYGWQANKITETNSQDIWGLNGSVSVPIVAGGRNAQSIRQARSAVVVADVATQKAVLKAIAEVESALALDVQGRAQLDAVRAQRDAAQQAYDVASAQYLRGTTSFLSVLSASQTLQGAQLTEIQTARSVLSARIQLLDALGSGTPSGATASLEAQP